MKNKFYNFARVSAFLIIVLFSCSEETEGPVYDLGGNDYVSLWNDSQVEIISDDDAGIVRVPIYHFNKDKSSTVKLNVEFLGGSSDYITLSSSDVLTFGKEESVVNLEFTFDQSQMEYLVDYQINISIDEENSTASLSPLSTAVSSLQLTIKRALTFNSIGACLFQSEFNEGESDVEVFLAEQAEVYRLTDLYEEGYSVDILVEGTNVTVLDQPGWFYSSSYGEVYIKGSGVLEDGILKMNVEHYLPSISYSFGIFQEWLILPQ